MLTAEQIQQVQAAYNYDVAMRRALLEAGIVLVQFMVDVTDTGTSGLSDEALESLVSGRLLATFEKDVASRQPKERASVGFTGIERRVIASFIAWMIQEQRRDDVAGGPKNKALLARAAEGR